MGKLTKKKVGVFLVGSRKSGTTSLANLLASHKSISLSSNKEPNYFNNLDRKSLSSYHKLFDWNTEIQLDASTSYTAESEDGINVSQEIKSYNPNAKIIFVIRDPLDRILSHYRMSYERGDLNISLNEALRTHKLLLSCSRYYSQITKYIEAFGRDKVLILNNQELNSPATEKNLISFLNLDGNFDRRIGIENAADTDYRMPRSIDVVLNNKLYTVIKSFFPKSIVSLIKLKYYQGRNKNMSIELSDASKGILKKELLEEMYSLQKVVAFDITSWINKLNKL